MATMRTDIRTRPELSAFSALPEELLNMIADYSMAALLHLRMTCRAIQHKTRRVFLQRYIRTRHVWIDEGALERMDRLAMHPDLQDCVTKIVIHLGRWSEDLVQERWRRPTNLSGQERQDYESVIGKLNDQQYLLVSGKATLTLSRIFRNLPQLEVLALEPHIRYHDLWPYSHFKYAFHSCLTNDLRDEEHLVKIWLSVIQSLIESNVQLKGFRVASALPLHCFTTLSRNTNKALSNTFSRLEVISLTCLVPSTLLHQGFWRDAFDAFISNCSNLTELDLSFQAYSMERLNRHLNEPAARSLAAWPSMPKLTSLRMRGLDVLPKAEATAHAEEF